MYIFDIKIKPTKCYIQYFCQVEREIKIGTLYMIGIEVIVSLICVLEIHETYTNGRNCRYTQHGYF